MPWPISPHVMGPNRRGAPPGGDASSTPISMGGCKLGGCKSRPALDSWLSVITPPSRAFAACPCDMLHLACRPQLRGRARSSASIRNVWSCGILECGMRNDCRTRNTQMRNASTATARHSTVTRVSLYTFALALSLRVCSRGSRRARIVFPEAHMFRASSQVSFAMTGRQMT